MWVLYERINFFITLLIAELIVCSKFKKRRYFWLRIIAASIPPLLISYFWVMMFSGSALIFLNAVRFLVIFLLSMAVLLVCYKSDVWSILFAAAAGYCMQHISYQTHSIIDAALGDVPLWGQVVTLVLCCAAYYALLYFFFVRRLKFSEGSVCINNMGMLWMTVVIILIAVFVSFYGAVYSIGAQSAVLLTIVCLFSIFSCTIAIMFLKALNAIKQGEQERAVLQHMLYQAKLQYDATEENINIINIKCHDLKHKILSLNDRVDNDELKKISTAVDIYDSSFDTGNKALDVVLTEKSLLCRGKGIRLTCMIDGSVLTGWSAGDIYSFFGNALDNAINSVSELEEEKRTISISSFTRGKLATVRMENYYRGEMKFEDGLPVTSGDRRYHGFGMKSIRMVAESYGCIVNVSAEEDIFCLELFVSN